MLTWVNTMFSTQLLPKLHSNYKNKQIIFSAIGKGPRILTLVPTLPQLHSNNLPRHRYNENTLRRTCIQYKILFAGFSAERAPFRIRSGDQN